MSDKIYYDESCHVCSWEINKIRSLGEANGIEFVDLTKGSYPEKYNREMAGEFDGVQTYGIETFRLMYERMGFKKSVAFSRLPVMRQIFNIGYKIFAYGIRPHLPKKRSTDE